MSKFNGYSLQEEMCCNSVTINNSWNSEKILVNDVYLNYIRRGQGQHAILCIPGALAPCGWSFASQLEYFGTEDSNYTVITFDPRGYGHSRPYDRNFTYQKGEHHLKRDAIDAYHLMVKLGLPSFSVLGWCDGGVTGIFLAALFPDAVKNLLVWGSRVQLCEQDLKLSEKLEDIKNWGAEFRAAFTPVYGDVKEILRIYRKFGDSLRAFLAENKDGDICSNEMAQVKCRALIVHGEKDAMSPKHHADHIKDRIKGSTLHLLSDGKHNLHMGRTSNEFNILLGQFLSDYSHCTYHDSYLGFD